MAGGSFSVPRLFADMARFLAFRPMSDAVREHRGKYLVAGLLATWLAGIGRYWDHPTARAWQVAGLGSLAYVVVLSLVLWLLLRPLWPRHWTLPNVLLFATLTSPPALLYAIPVERFLPADTAVRVNVWFLAIVAGWRVALLVNFLRKVGGLSRFATLVATLLPLTLIVTSLAALNLERAVFDIMGGIVDGPPSASDEAYAIVVALTLLSVTLSPFVVIAYIALAWAAWDVKSPV
ncbi:MAG TPA: hypothetical protein VFL14_04960 [Xanthomonadales bacterium]|nr:hypothetical protein [Xanthomonadales bacterium]